jgi:hypothetical protein
MSIAIHSRRGRATIARARSWQKPWQGTLPETALYSMLFLWVGTEHSFVAASAIASVLAVFCSLIPR